MLWKKWWGLAPSALLSHASTTACILCSVHTFTCWLKNETFLYIFFVYVTNGLFCYFILNRCSEELIKTVRYLTPSPPPVDSLCFCYTDTYDRYWKRGQAQIHAYESTLISVAVNQNKHVYVVRVDMNKRPKATVCDFLQNADMWQHTFCYSIEWARAMSTQHISHNPYCCIYCCVNDWFASDTLYVCCCMCVLTWLVTIMLSGSQLEWAHRLTTTQCLLGGQSKNELRRVCIHKKTNVKKGRLMFS